MLVGASAVARPDGLFLFDTGASTIDDGALVRRSRPGRASRQARDGVRTYGGNVARRCRRCAASSCDSSTSKGDGSTVFTSDLTQRSRLGGVEVSGFLGLDLLDGTTIVVDTRARSVAVAAAAARN